MQIGTKYVSLDKAIETMSFHRAPSIILDYVKSFKVGTGKIRESVDIRNKRNSRGIIIHNGVLLGVAVTTRYDLHGKELFSEWRTVDEVATLWVPQANRTKGLGHLLFKEACKYILDYQDPSWIYVRAVSVQSRAICESLDENTHLRTKEYPPESNDFLFELKNSENKKALRDYCQRA